MPRDKSDSLPASEKAERDTNVVVEVKEQTSELSGFFGSHRIWSQTPAANISSHRVTLYTEDRTANQSFVSQQAHQITPDYTTVLAIIYDSTSYIRSHLFG